MQNSKMIEKLQAAQALIYELLDNPALDREANSSLYCADNCLGEAVQYLRDSSKPLATIYFQYFDCVLGGLREDQAPLYANKTPEECAREELKKHIQYDRRKLEFVKINFIQGA